MKPIADILEDAARHTPGPWFVNPLKALVEVPDRDAPICAMLWPTDLRSEDETFANARLLATAPELVTALAESIAQMEIVRRNLEDAGVANLGAGPLGRQCDMSRAVLARVCGDTA